MITRTFSHIAGVGKEFEKKLWAQGILSWAAFIKHNHPNTKRISAIKNALLDSFFALESGNHHFFSASLPSSEHWRLFKEFSKCTAYVDIETTGLSPDYCEITTIALYDGKEIKYYINGKNLYEFLKDIRQYDLLVTFNGKGFDVPFIQQYFGTELKQSHIDLRYVLASLGFSGGLKACEKAFGLARNELEGVDGRMAVYLWTEYKKGKKSALDTLLAYNIEDVINLEYLMYTAYNLKIKELGLGDALLEVPTRPMVPFKADSKLISKLKAKYFPEW